MRNQSIIIASVFALLLGSCGDIVESDSSGNPNAPDVISLSVDRVPLGGGSVTLMGTGFTEGTTVVLGTTRVADVTIASEEELTFQAPAGEVAEVALPLAVFNDSGTTVLEEALTYNELPTLISSSPPVGRVGAGGTLRIQGTRFVTNNAGPVTVHIGDAELANVEVVDDETITASLPDGNMDLVAVAQDIVVTMPNGVIVLPERFTFVAGGLFFSRARISNGGPGGSIDQDEGVGLYYVEPTSKRVAYVLPMSTGIAKLAGTPNGGIAVRFSNRGSEALSSNVYGTLNLAEGKAEPLGNIKAAANPFANVRVRALALAHGAIYGIGEWQQSNPCCTSFREIGQIDPTTRLFTAVTTSDLDRNACLVAGPVGELLAIRRFNEPIRIINIGAGTVSDGPALTGDLDVTPGNTPTCHGADRLNGVIYAIRFSRDNDMKSTLVSITPGGAVTEIVELPSGSTGLVANPLP